MRGVTRENSDIYQREDPELTGRIKIDEGDASWKMHAWIEGGWDSTVNKPPRDSSLFKTYDKVYQSNSPFIEFKELFASYAPGDFELKAGIQRYAWGRLDEYPPNDLLNPWDYTRFLLKPLEDRKIGVPSISATLNKSKWTYEAVWVPVFVPYRLPMPDERWSGIPLAAMIVQAAPSANIMPQEPVLPDRTIENSSIGVRIKHAGDIELALNLFHGIDPRPVFTATALNIVPQIATIEIDPGYVPDFHPISVIGMDAAAVRGDLSIRAEAAYAFNRYLNIRRELWGYSPTFAPGVYPLNPIELIRDTFDYGIGADYRLFEDGLLTVQAQQTIILGDVEPFYQRKAETILWANLKIGWMNQKIETNLNMAYNPEHGDTLSKAKAMYVFSDSWKASVTAIDLNGPAQSIFGRYSRNDQVEAEVIYAW